MNKAKIIITEEDHATLSKLIADLTHLPPKRSDVRSLEEELNRARIVPPSRVPPDVITMNSRAELLDLDTGETEEFTVVFPSDADIDSGRISILAPIGMGMLGYRVGDVFEQRAPFGVRRLKVLAVNFQPEALLELAVP